MRNLLFFKLIFLPERITQVDFWLLRRIFLWLLITLMQKEELRFRLDIFAQPDVWKTFFRAKLNFWIACSIIFFLYMFVSISEMDRFIIIFLPWFVSRSFTLRIIQFKIFDSFFRIKYYPIAWLSSKEKTISAKILHIKTTSAWYSTIFQKRYRTDSKWQSWHFCLFKS